MTLAPTLDRDSPLPLYAQVKRSLQARIMVWPADSDRFYTDQELQDLFQVSRATVRQALTELESEGLVQRRRGFGTFVNRDKIEESFAAQADFQSQWAQSGRHLRVANLKLERGPCPAHFAKILGLAAHAEVLIMERLRLTGDLRVAWDQRYLPLDIAGDIDRQAFENVSLIDVLRPRVSLVRAETQIEATLAGEAYAEQLHVDPASVVLIREMSYFGADGRAAFAGVSVYRADQVRYKFSAPLEAGGAPVVDSVVRVAPVERSSTAARKDTGTGVGKGSRSK